MLKNQNQSIEKFCMCFAKSSKSLSVGLIFLWKKIKRYFVMVLAGYHQKRLLEKLFRKYNKIERPVANDSSSLNVTVGLALQQIVDVVSNL